MTNAEKFRLNSSLFPVVAAALINGEGRVLVQRRPAGKQMAGLWEFPGGKIEPGETPEIALVRELSEELGIDVNPADLSAAIFASAPLGERHLLLLLFLCRAWKGEPRALDADAIQWLHPESLRDLAMPPADEPLVALLESLM